MSRAWLYDGENAVRHEVEVGRLAGGLRLRFADGRELDVESERLVHVESRRAGEVYGRSDVPGWRLGFDGSPPAELAAVLPPPQRYGRWVDRIGLVPALLIGLVLSASVLLAGSRLPVWLAPLVPAEWEERFGDNLVGDFGGEFCAGAGGQEALNRLAAKLSSEPHRLNVRVVPIDIVNAAALPGGNIVIFEELLAEADGPDEVAGVLAHEIAHVERRHVTQTMIRELGLGVIVTGFGGDAGASIHSLMAAGYSRSSEREADADAVAKLRRANISPLPTAAFFDRLAAAEARLGRMAEGLSWISTHPMSAERRRLFRDSAERGRSYAPALGRDEWDALFSICFNDPEIARNARPAEIIAAPER